MAVNNRISDFSDEIAQWRQTIHQHPGLQYDVEETADFVVKKLRECGVDEITEKIGRTGVVALIKGRKTTSGKVIGMRADMDALPIVEKTNKPYKSKYEGKMHACGHDGHTAMLLGAAKYLSETRNFNGTVALIFQPAEEGEAGGKAMVDDGMMDKFNIQEVYGLHNMPGIDIGKFAICAGPIMAASDQFTITIKGQGSHAAEPQSSIDPIIISAHIITALQTIVSRNADPLHSLVVSVTSIQSGSAYNIIPQESKFIGSIRTLDSDLRTYAHSRLKEVVESISHSFGATADIKIHEGYPVTSNHPPQTDFAAKAAIDVVGESNVDSATLPDMAAEDFSYMLLERPGAYIFLGNGDSAVLHHEEYDFDDTSIPIGCSWWAKIAENAMPVD